MVPRRLALLLLLAACSSPAGGRGAGSADADVPVPPAPAGVSVRTARDATYAEVLADLAGVDVVYVAGDCGDATCREILLGTLDYLFENKRLHAVGLEIFERQFQAALDDYAFGRTDEADLLARTEFARRGPPSIDPYRPLLEFARDRRLPILALAPEGEVRAAVAQGGLAALTEAQRLGLPAVRGDDAREAAEDLLEAVAADVLVRWYRGAAPEGAQVLILAARERVAPRKALPERLFSRTGRTYRTLVVAPEAPAEADRSFFAREYADYLWFTGTK